MTDVEPVFFAVTSPVALTVAIELSVVPHVTLRPVSVLPFASLSVAVIWRVPLTAIDGFAGVTVTVTTGASVTLKVDVAL